MCHPRCVCENWEGYAVKHNYVNRDVLITFNDFINRVVFDYIPFPVITAVLRSVEGLVVLRNRPIRVFAWNRKLTFQIAIIVVFLS